MTITQLVITVAAVLGVVVVGLLAIIPSLLDYPPHRRHTAPPMGRDKDEPDLPAPATGPSRTRHRRHPDRMDLAA